MSDSTVDVLVVGGGPAGAVASRTLAERGYRVRLVDRDTSPRWKVCGACLSGRGVAALRDAGLPGLTDALGATRPEHLQIQHRGRRVTLPLEGTVVVSRLALDAALLDAAGTAGVDVTTGCTAVLGEASTDAREVVLRSGDETESVRARLVIGATGLSPLQAQTAEPPPRPRVASSSRIGAGAVFPAGAFGDGDPGADTVRMVVGSRGYLGIGTLEDGRLDVAAALEPGLVRKEGGLDAAIARILEESGHPLPIHEPTEGWRGTPALTRSLDRPGARRLLVIGDAASYVEPFTGEGMTWAIEDARAVAPFAHALLEGADPERVLDDWARDRLRRTGRSRRLIRAVAWLTRGSLRSSLTLGLLSAVPALARPFVRSAASAPTSSDVSLRHEPA